MKKVLALLLLAFVMCQCNNQTGQNKSNDNSDRSKYPEKFTEEYIGERSLTLADRLCNSDPYNVYTFNNSFTNEYGYIGPLAQNEVSSLISSIWAWDVWASVPL